MRRIRRIARFAPAALLAAAVGCSDGLERCYPVRGVVAFEDGTPATVMAGASVTFIPAEKERQSATATIAPDGTYVLSTRKKEDGAVAGKHRAVIELPYQGETANYPGRMPPLKTLIDPATAAQEVTVEKQSNTITLTVRRPKK